jgi:hypothetical protein
MARFRIASLTVLAAFGTTVAACSGGYAGGNASLPSTLGDSGLTVSDTADALIARRTGSQNARAGIVAANALGARIRQLVLLSVDDVWEDAVPAVTPMQRCHNGVELFAPDRNGDPDSTEALFFYDPTCRQLAVDDVRIYAPTSANSETVNRSDSFYLPASTAAVATATTRGTIGNATFGNYGLPLVANGFALHSASTLSFLKTPVLFTDAEFVMMPGSQASNAFCEDSAGYDPTGIASLDETFGWQGGALSGASRTTIGKAFERWSAAPSGTLYTGSIGALSIASGAPNATCPIATPAFTLSGGTAIGSYSIPLVITFHHGTLWNVSVRRARLPNGDTLNVTTRGGRRDRRDFIKGSLRNGGTPIATFAVNGFGNGELTVTSTGAQYRIVDWIVVQ